MPRRNAVRHLIEGWGAQALAEIDPEEFTDFATVRPHVRLIDGRTRTIVWPTVGLWSASTPGGDVILVLGPEPALRWRLFTRADRRRRRALRRVASCSRSARCWPTCRTPDPVQLIGTATDQT